MSLFFVITLLLNVTFGKTETRSETCQVELLIEGAHNFSSLIKGLNCSKGTLTHLTLAAKNSTINTYMTIRDTDLDFIGNISTKNVTIVVKYVKHVRFYLQSCMCFILQGNRFSFNESKRLQVPKISTLPLRMSLQSLFIGVSINYWTMVTIQHEVAWTGQRFLLGRPLTLTGWVLYFSCLSH